MVARSLCVLVCLAALAIATICFFNQSPRTTRVTQVTGLSTFQDRVNSSSFNATSVEARDHWFNGSGYPSEPSSFQSRGNTACFTANSFEARDHWLNGSGYIMIHHVPRAGGTTLCGLLATSSNDLVQNCVLPPSLIVGNDGRDRSSLGKLKSLSQLEAEMKRQGKRVVAVEAYPLPDWFLNDPRRSQKWTIVTSIRDPVDRLVSYSRSRCRKNPRECWKRPVDTFSELPLDNYMTRMFVGGSLRDARAPVTEKDYEMAMKNLEAHYQLIFITEWIPEMTPILKYWLGLEGSGNERRGYDGKHSVDASKLGMNKSVLHYIPESSAEYYLRREPEVYSELAKRNYYDLKLLKHFQQREKLRATDCFVFQTKNISP